MHSECASHNESIILKRFVPLLLVRNTPKGRGIFAGRDISSGIIIDTCPVLVLDPKENTEHIEKTNLYDYTYNWPVKEGTGSPSKTQAVVLGLGSMFNHSRGDQNVGWERDLTNELVVYRALRDIREGEELCISYGDHLTFVDADRSQSTRIVEREDEVLRAIQLESS